MDFLKNFPELISATAALISATSTVLIASAALFFLKNYLRDRSQSHYNETLKRSELSEMREAYERKIGELSGELTATKARWQDVNHLLLESQNAQIEPIQNSEVLLTPFLYDMGLSPADLIVDKNLVFVLTPFGTEHLKTYEAIVQTCSEIGLRCARGDEENASGNILPQILRLLVKARFIIANVGSRNPNVFYELGIAHALGKPTILIAETLNDVPFDVAAKRIVIFENVDKLRSKLLPFLARTLRENSIS